MLKRTLVAFFCVVSFIVTSSFPAPVFSAGTTTTTAFALQNMGSATANVAIDYRNTSGSVIMSQAGITMTAGSSVTFDQSLQSGLGTSFLGGAIVSSDQPMGSVVNIARKATTSGAVNAYE